MHLSGRRRGVTDLFDFLSLAKWLHRSVGSERIGSVECGVSLDSEKVHISFAENAGLLTKVID